MHNHEPEHYDCPFCREMRAYEQGRLTESSVIERGESVSLLLGLYRWERNPVNLLVVPVEHIENLYDLPERYAAPIQAMSRAAALALKAVYGCEGVSLRQHNEPAGSQDVWHYHMHVTPRFSGDDLYAFRRVDFPEAERQSEAARLREYLSAHRAGLFGQ